MKARFLLVLCTTSLCLGECVSVEPQRFGRVHFEAFSVLGERLEEISVSLVGADDRQSVRSNINGATATKVPFGLYEARVWAPGFRSVRREFRLSDSEMSVRVQLAVADECGVQSAFGGTVRPLPRDRQLWVKMVPLKGVGGYEVPVQRSGSFRFSGLDAGQYLLLLVDGKDVVYSTMTTGPSAPAMEIILPRRP